MTFAWPWRLSVVLALAAFAAVVWSTTAPQPAAPVTYRDQMRARGAAAPAAEIAAAVRDSLYLLTIELPSGRRVPVGTAFVMRRADGSKVLATTARVADLFRRDLQSDPDLNGGRMMAAQPLPPDYQAVRITGAEVHPAWDALGAAAAYWPAFDIALLSVDVAERLGPPLETARRSALAELKAGDALVLAGYLDDALPDSDLTRPAPRTEVGVVTAMTGADRMRGGDSAAQVIQTSLPAADGAAGSPLLSADGAVVGVFVGGDPAGLLHGTAPGAARIDALVTLAMRADLLRDLLDGTAEADVPAIVAAWAASGLDRMADAPPPDPLDQLRARAGPGASVAPVFAASGFAGVGDPLFPGARVAGFAIDLPGPGLYLAVARSLEGKAVVAVLRDADGRIADVGTAGGPVSTCLVRSAERARVTLMAVMPGGAAGQVQVQITRAAPP